jgi:alkylglycerol monooxygenase
MDILELATPLFIAAMLFELAYGWRRGRNTYRVNDAVGSLFLGSLSQARKFVTLGVGGLVYHLVSEHLALEQMDPTHWSTWVLATVVYDFCYYWLHRLGHERTLLWAAHVAHHQSEDYNLSTALRQTSTGFLLGWIFYIPMFVLGIPAEVVVTTGALNLIYQFWVHTQHVPKLGWYEWIFVTPSNHRVHHAQNDRYLDRNYGGLFIIWDRLFGTFQEELEEDPPVFGIRGPLHSFSPFKALTHIYVDMFLDAWRAGSWRDKLHVLWARTGWRPADVARAHPRDKADLSQFEVYDPPTPLPVRAYALFQLVAVVGLLLALQSGVAKAYAGGALLALAMLLTGTCTALWLDARRAGFCLAADAARIGLFAILLWQWGGAHYTQTFLALAAAYLCLNALWLPLLGRASPGVSAPGVPLAS